ncbi:type IV secretion system protein VirB3 [Castellaniella sp.]|uniref:type IV secretion system protein VirB3 n=1 Tax=Castellaniella sp. TaxID=1955812 RepID=UPI003A8E1095
MATHTSRTRSAHHDSTGQTPDSHRDPTTYLVFKGLGRKATFMGIPTTLLLGAFAVVAIIAMTAGLAWWGLLFVVMPALAIITRDDDKSLDILWLEIKTRRTNRQQRFWRGSSYAPQGYHHDRPWRRFIS